MIFVTRILVCLYLLVNASWNQETSLGNHSFSPMHVWKKHSARFSLFWYLLLSWNMICLRKSRCTITTTFKLNYHIQSIDTEWAKHHFFFCFLVRNIWHLPASFNNFMFLPAMKTSEPASLENYKFSNSLYIELSNKQHSICIYVFAVVKFTVFFTTSRM